jgi:hypothetical protein
MAEGEQESETGPEAPEAELLDRLGLSPDLFQDSLQASIEHAASASVAPGNAWSSIGPRNIGGRIRDLLQDPNAPLTLYAGAAFGGVFRSLDGGETWDALGKPEDAMPVGALGISSDSTLLYVGSGEPVANHLPGRGLYKVELKADASACVFTQLVTPLPGLADATKLPGSANRYARIQVDPQNSARFWAASNRGLWRYEDGKFALELTSDDDNVTDLVIDFRDPASYRAYVAIYDKAVYGFRYVPNQGPSSLKKLRGLDGRIRLAVCKNQPQHVFAIDAADGFAGRVHHSADYGDSWQVGDYFPMERSADPSGQPDYALLLAVHPERPNIVVAGEVDLAISTNFGASFARLIDWRWHMTRPELHADQHAIAWNESHPEQFWVANDGGIALTTDLGRSFRRKCFGLDAAQFNDVTVHPSVPFILGGGLQDNGTYVGFGGSGWYHVWGGDGGTIAFDPNAANALWAPSQTGLQHLTLSGETRDLDYDTLIRADLAANPERGIDPADKPLWVAVLEQNPRDSAEILVGREGGAYVSEDARLQALFFEPPLGIARLGAGAEPVDAFDWGSADPHAIAETRIVPAWTLKVQGDGSVEPSLPQEIVFRDGDKLRPVAPFFELWALTGDSADPTQWRPRPLTTARLEANALALGDIELRVTARNSKAARRTRNPNLAFGVTTPPIRGDHHDPVALEAISPSVATPMIPSGRSIPLGSVRVIRPKPQPSGAAWAGQVNIRLDAVRVRFTPALGRFYGPPVTAEERTMRNVSVRPVPAENAFLDPAAGWFNAPRIPEVSSQRVRPAAITAPGDTYDFDPVPTIPAGQTAPAFGVVDDTCDARIELTLTRKNLSPLSCRANIFSGPPDFAPDRRPFLSLADELNDRESDPAPRDAGLSGAELDRWVEDLFERVFETVQLLNVDAWRDTRAKTLTGAELGPAIPNDATPEATRALGGQDALRDPLIAIPARSTDVPLPLAERARERHRNLSDIAYLRTLVRENPTRLEQLIRPPFRVGPGEGLQVVRPGPPPVTETLSTMQMPPFMRNSNAQPLTLSRWQYDLLLKWVEGVKALPALAMAAPRALGFARAAAPPLPALSPEAERRRSEVLSALGVDDSEET